MTDAEIKPELTFPDPDGRGTLIAPNADMVALAYGTLVKEILDNGAHKVMAARAILEAYATISAIGRD